MARSHWIPITLATGLLGAVSLTALAQTSPPPPADSGRTIPEKDPAAKLKGAPKPDVTVTRSSNLSDKLSRSNGVIRPPADVDPGMQAPAPVPNPNSTPVIKPPTAGSGAVKAK